MADGYNRCKKCGVVYVDEGKGYCPTCGTPAGSEKGGVSRLFYSFDKKEFIGIVVMAIIAIAFAAFNIYTVVDCNNDIAQNRADYEMAKSIVDSGLYDSILNEYYEMKGIVESGQYYIDDATLQSYYEAKAAVESMPGDIRAELADYEARLFFIDALSVSYIIVCSALIIGSVLMLIRIRFSFKIMMIAYILSIITIAVFEIWGLVSYGISSSGASIGIRIAIAVSLIKTFYRYDQMAYEDVKSDKGWVSVSPAAAGVPMPAVKELNSDFDSFIAQTPPDKEMESVGVAKPDTEMASVAPVGTAVPTERDKLFQPTEVAPAAQPVMPLADASARRADVGVMTGEVVTPLDRPMIPVDMMEDEAMPDISLSQAQPAPAYTAPQPVQSTASVQPMQPTPEISKGIWFCSKCGSLNENANFCNSCGERKG